MNTLVFEDENESSWRILMHILGAVGGLDNIASVEENAGSLWITLKDGTTHYIMVAECEKEEE